MIHLHTGLPGAGKTLCTIVEVEKRAQAEKRTVYYNGIAELKLGWVELEDATEWHKLPPNSIIVIDEAQRVFRPRHTSAKVPDHVEALETHRHRGHDLYVITQHPKLLDSNIRRLVGVHVHFVRAFGSNAVTRHEWGEVKDDPSSREDSQRTLVPYDKSAFDLYKSAEVHTHKIRLPRRVFVLAIFPLLAVGLGWFIVKWFANPPTSLANLSPASSSSSPAKSSGAPSQGPASGRERAPSTDPAQSAMDYVGARTPRVPGLAHTAPVYDAVTQPVHAPYPAVCISSATRCKCYTEQATPLDMADALCRQLAASGYFREFEPASKQQREQATRAAPAAPTLDSPPPPAPVQAVELPAADQAAPRPRVRRDRPSTSPLQNNVPLV